MSTSLRNRGLQRFDFNTGTTNMRPGDPSYSPTDAVTQSPVQYGQRSEAPTQQRGPEQSQGWWSANVPTRQINPAQYIDQNVGGKSGDNKRLGWSKGIVPFTTNRQPFTGAVLTPPRPRVLVVGNVGRLGQRDTLQARVTASTNDYQPSAAQVANTMVNPQLGW